MVAQRYGQDPRVVATWEPEWLAAAVTAMEAEAGAAKERDAAAARRNRMRRG